MRHDSFYLKPDSAIPIVVVGKAGKTIIKSLLQSIFEDHIFIDPNADHISNIDQIIRIKNNAHQHSRPYLLDIDLHHFEDVAEIIEYIHPQIVIVTNLGDAHLVYKAEKSTLAMKTEAFIRHLEEETLVLLNRDDDQVAELENLISNGTSITFGLNRNSDVYAADIEQNGPMGITFKLNQSTPFTVPIYQFYQIYNILISISVARLFNVPLTDIQQALSDRFQVPPGRSNLVQLGRISIINDTFHHTFQSITTAAQTLVTFKQHSTKMVMVISDVIHENRENLRQLHINLGHFLSALPIDVIITVGEHAKHIGDGLQTIPNPNRTIIHTEDVNEAVMDLVIFLEDGDSILLKTDPHSGITRFIDVLREKIH